MQCENFSEKWNNMDCAMGSGHIMDYAQTLRKWPNKAKQTILEHFRNLVMHFHKTPYRLQIVRRYHVFHNSIGFHWVSEIYIPKCILFCHSFGIRIGRITQFQQYLTYDFRFCSSVNRAIYVCTQIWGKFSVCNFHQNTVGLTRPLRIDFMRADVLIVQLQRSFTTLKGRRRAISKKFFPISQ